MNNVLHLLSNPGYLFGNLLTWIHSYCKVDDRLLYLDASVLLT